MNKFEKNLIVTLLKGYVDMRTLIHSKITKRNIVFQRRSPRCKKFTDRQVDRQTETRTDDGQHVIRKAHLNL